MSDIPTDGWTLLVRQGALDRPGEKAWLGSHPRYQYKVTVWVDGAGRVVAGPSPTYVA